MRDEFLALFAAERRTKAKKLRDQVFPNTLTALTTKMEPSIKEFTNVFLLMNFSLSPPLRGEKRQRRDQILPNKLTTLTLKMEQNIKKNR